MKFNVSKDWILKCAEEEDPPCNNKPYSYLKTIVNKLKKQEAAKDLTKDTDSVVE